MNKEIIETLTKVNDFIEANKNINYKIRLLEREVPNIGELVKKLHMQNVSNNEVAVCPECKSKDLTIRLYDCNNCSHTFEV